jgi:hypothetical protein
MPRWKGRCDDGGLREGLGDADGCEAAYLAADDHPASATSSTTASMTQTLACRLTLADRRS